MVKKKKIVNLGRYTLCRRWNEITGRARLNYVARRVTGVLMGNGLRLCAGNLTYDVVRTRFTSPTAARALEAHVARFAILFKSPDSWSVDAPFHRKT